MVPDSIMPSFKWLYAQVRVPVKKGDEGLTLQAGPELARWFTMKAEPRIRLYPNRAGPGVRVTARRWPWPIEGTPVST